MITITRRIRAPPIPALAKAVRLMSGPRPGQVPDDDDPVEEMDEFDRELCSKPIDPKTLTDNDLAVKPAEPPSVDWIRETDAAIDNDLIALSAKREGVQADADGNFLLGNVLTLEDLDEKEYQHIMRKHIDKLPNMLGGRRPPIPPVDFDEGGDVWGSTDLDLSFWPGAELDEPAELQEGILNEKNEFDLSKIGNIADDNSIDPELSYAVLSIDRRTKVTKSGRIFSISALVAAGNCNGLAGFAVGRGKTSEEAERKAMRKAAKSMVFVPRLFEDALYHDTEGKKGATKVLIQAVPPGRGLRCSKLIRCFMELFGIRDVTCKVIGSSNPYNVCHALLHGLTKQQDHGLIRAIRGNGALPLRSRVPPVMGRLPAGFDAKRTPDRIKSLLTSLDIQ